MRSEPALTRTAGFTLVELMIVITISVLLAVLAVPRFEGGLEAMRVDNAAQSLRSVWNGQRLYRLEHGVYATTLAQLGAEGLIDASLAAQSDPFVFRIVDASGPNFTASAARAGSSAWHGTIAIDQAGAMSGSTTDGEGSDVSPLD